MASDTEISRKDYRITKMSKNKTKFPYDPNWTDPSSVDRRVTNFFGLVFTVIWLVIHFFLGIIIIVRYIKQGHDPKGRMIELKLLTRSVKFNLTNWKFKNNEDDWEPEDYYYEADDYYSYADSEDWEHSQKPNSNTSKELSDIIGLFLWFFGLCIGILITIAMTIVIFKLVKKFPKGTAKFYFFLSYIVLLINSLHNPEYNLGLPKVIGSNLMLAVMTIFIFLCQKEIRIGYEIIKLTCNAVLSFPRIPLVSVMQFLITLPFLIYFLVIFNCLTHLDSLAIDKLNYLLLVYGLTNLWLIILASDSARLIVSNTVASWYWTQDKNLITSNVGASVKLIYRYHYGTAAVGSFLVSVFIIILISPRVHTTPRWNQDSKYPNGSTSHQDGSLQLLLSIFYLFMIFALPLTVYVTRSAYVMTASHGKGFFESVEMAFYLIKRNKKLTLVNLILMANAIFWISLIFITLPANLFMKISLFKQVNISLIMSICNLVAMTFLFAFDIAFNAIFVSVMEDSERNDISESKFMTDELKALMASD